MAGTEWPKGEWWKMRPKSKHHLVNHKKEMDIILIATGCHWRACRCVFKERRTGIHSDLFHDLPYVSILPAQHCSSFTQTHFTKMDRVPTLCKEALS